MQDSRADRERLDEILDLILETVCTSRKQIRIAGDDYPAELVKAKFMKLNSEHIRFDLADYYGGLHFGECLEMSAGGKWKPTRIEYGEGWYLVGIRAEDLNGLRVREIELALPRELTREQGISLVREYVKRRFVAEGM